MMILLKLPEFKMSGIDGFGDPTGFVDEGEVGFGGARFVGRDVLDTGGVDVGKADDPRSEEKVANDRQRQPSDLNTVMGSLQENRFVSESSMEDTQPGARSVMVLDVKPPDGDSCRYLHSRQLSLPEFMIPVVNRSGESERQAMAAAGTGCTRSSTRRRVQTEYTSNDFEIELRLSDMVPSR